MKWIPVTKANPCPICNKPDWCRHGELGTHCQRSEGGKRMPNGGGFFAHDKPHTAVSRPLPKEPEREYIDAKNMMAKWSLNTDPSWIDALANSLGVSAISLTVLCASWAAPHNAWAFPMRDGWGEVIGIRLRANNGQKWAVTGSRQGIFVPDCQPQTTAYVCEGPTDTAAAISIGLFAVGRPSCQGGTDQIRTLFSRLSVKRAVLASDNDKPGLKGAARLADEIGIPTCTFIPPAKDFREFVNNGGTKQIIEAMTKSLVWNQPKPHNQPHND